MHGMLTRFNLPLVFRHLFGCIALLSASQLKAQLTVSQQGAANLVNNILLGQGVTASNITFTGNAQMLGSFNGANSNIGLANGVILSSGRIQDAPGPNNSPSKGEDLGANGSPLLESILDGADTEDAAVLRFNFVCEGDKVQFRYVFASEEYPEFVGSEFNDAFGFFIQGPGITGTQNLAIIPTTTSPVTINNVNAGSNASYFVNNGNGTSGGGSSVQFDGFTRPLVAQATVIPCEQYTITIVIADVSDGIYDSAVFLEGQSFTSPEVMLKGEVSYVEGADELFEDCGFIDVTFSRSGPSNAPLTIFLDIEGTATYGVDYTGFPTTITFAPGQTEISFPIAATMDNIVEPGGETISIVYRDTGCTQIIEKRLDYIIFDPPPPVGVFAGNPVVKLCPRVPVDLNATVSGGVGPYLIQWEGNVPGNPVVVYPDSTQYYTVSITDQCGAVLTDSVLVTIKDYVPLRLYLSDDTTICKGVEARIAGYSTGGKAPISYSWETPGITQPFRDVQPEETTVYKLTVTDSCAISITESITVNVIEVNAIFDVRYLTHNQVQFIDLSYEDVVNWDWDFGDNSGTSQLQNPIYTFPDTGLFVVTLISSNQAACKDTVQNPIRSYPPFNLWIPNAFTPDGDGLNDQFSGIGEGFISYEMAIYNRWGEQIFFSDNYRDKWGEGPRSELPRIPIDVYSYKIWVSLPTLERKQYIGRVTVIR
jgi:hypothetical protein